MPDIVDDLKLWTLVLLLIKCTAVAETAALAAAAAAAAALAELLRTLPLFAPLESPWLGWLALLLRAFK